jgi:S1-C subfamily serine protease
MMTRDLSQWAAGLLCSLCMIGCGAKSEPPPRTEATATRAADAGAKLAGARLSRGEVMATLSAGFGAFLAHLQVEPVVVDGKFRGWRVLQLRPHDPMWSGVDLAPGDVISAVNGKSIERPEQALSAFQSLAIAPELRVSYQRGGVLHELVLPIDDAADAGG